MPESRLPLGNENDAAHCEKKKSPHSRGMGVKHPQNSMSLNILIKSGVVDVKRKIYCEDPFGSQCF